jgi:hypothetical protein
MSTAFDGENELVYILMSPPAKSTSPSDGSDTPASKRRLTLRPVVNAVHTFDVALYTSTTLITSDLVAPPAKKTSPSNGSDALASSLRPTLRPVANAVHVFELALNTSTTRETP